jgi:hypothetical protein
MKRKAGKASSAIREDVPFTARLPNGRTLFVLVPAKWCELDVSGEVMFRPDAVRFLDRLQVMAMDTPRAPTPGFLLTLREALGLTQAQLAAKVGVDKMTVARWEWGRVRPGPGSVKALDKLKRDAARKGVVIAA